MATKTISIKEKVYKKLVAMKRENESFSQLLNHLVNEQISNATLEKLRGIMEFEDSTSLIKKIEKRRED
ncbi:MAG: antitoxin VapB family protein [Candidatus Heimdallarchaeum endolithica]|uniref:Antitoxin VapB family protein n=1 Tax=Candidatus Heimdallarchaeum endolithica TaxID=2876572 RepID=A0A9Y1BSL2_9ARCH|nr:MAG: antitoxin VapB family protein [Candidatus Heimdallarchaeum endolithica]